MLQIPILANYHKNYEHMMNRTRLLQHNNFRGTSTKAQLKVNIIYGISYGIFKDFNRIINEDNKKTDFRCRLYL